ncbi:MAG: insulinase family protein [Muribaculaceae bacterium]|nr:insulinase family protein [Muribaculaceae bacterium]
MKLIRHITAIVVLTAMALPAPAAQRVLNDPSVRTGTLPNGLTYYVKQNNYPEHHADFFIAQRVGSIQEEENQRGLAHFLEHMCFNGTKHFPGNSLISYMESIGVKFGANLNAYTSTDETVYNISNVPTGRRSALDSCFLVLSDWSHDLLLRGKDIDEERGVIEGEWRHRSAASNRMLEKALPTLYPGSKYGQRMPIGLMSVVKNFKHKELRDYYKRWYHPSNQCIIVVGDIDPDYAVGKITELFGKIKNPKNATPVVPTSVPDNETIIATVQTDVEQPSTSVRLLFKHGNLPPELAGTTEWLRRDYLNYLVGTMLSARFGDLKQLPDAPFTHVGAADRNYLISKTRKAFQLTAVSKSNQATATMQWMAREVNRATQYGFTQSELRRARLNYEAALDKLYRDRNRYSNTQYARDFVRAYLEGEPIPSIEDNCTIMRRIMSEVTLEDVNNHLRSLVSTSDHNVVLTAFAPEKAGELVPTTQELIDAFHAGRAQQVEAYVDTLKADRLLLAEPTPGKIVSEEDAPAFGAKLWTLSNGIKVWVKKTDISPDEIVIAGAGPGGLSQNYRPEDAASLKVFGALAGTLGFGQFTAGDLKKVLAGKDVKMRTFVSKTE